MLRINNATNALTYVGALTDVERITRKARDARAALGDILGETLVTPGDARVEVVTVEYEGSRRASSKHGESRF